MQFNRNKVTTVSIIALLVLSIGATISLFPTATAHNPVENLPTNAYITALPSPVGVGQSTLIYMWLNRVFGYYPLGEISGSINYAAVNNNYRFHNFKLTITDPDGQVTTKTFDTIQDTTSSQSYSFTPTKVGTYMLKFEFPGQAVNASGGAYSTTSVMVNDYYLPSSATANLTVQADPIATYPDSYPLPTEYWTRPIYGENNYWWTISSNWLGTGAYGYGGFTASYNAGGNGAIFYAGDTVGPLTSHVMWTKMLQTGGVVGGDKFEITGNAYFEGSAYNQRYQNPIVVNGKIYYNEPLSFTGANAGPLVCVDLRTGQKLWSRSDIPQISFALIWDHEDPNQHGVFPAILSTANFGRLFDAETGAPLFNVTSMPSASYSALGPNGEQLKYVIFNNGTTQNPQYFLSEWNSTRLWDFGSNTFTGGSLLSPSILNITTAGALNALGQANPWSNTTGLLTNFPIPLAGSSMTLSNWTNVATNTNTLTAPFGSTLIVNGGANKLYTNEGDLANRYDWSVPITWRDTLAGGLTVLAAIPGDMMLCYNGTLPSQGATFMGTLGFNPYRYFAVNLNASKGTVGSLLWTNTVQPPAGNLTVLAAGFDPVARVFVENYRETQNFVGYNLDTGAKIWGPTASQEPMDYYGSQASGSLANTCGDGKLVSAAYAGIVYCYDIKTGNLLWTFGNGNTPDNSTNSGFQVPGNYPTFVNAIGNGVIYTVTSEHTVEMPIFKGGMSRALNETTGQQIWALSSYVTEFSTTSYAVADGYATWFNSYDNSIYSVGRGPSAISIEAPKSGVTLGNSLVITGSVIDTAAGTKQNEQAARFPTGVPVASDASMTEWMAYVYQQKPMPTTFTGVNVDVYVVDSNMNYRKIGTAQTAADGTYSLAWKPDIDGKFNVYATFAGTNAYWPSTASTAFVVDPAAATATPTPVKDSVADQYFVPAIAGIFVLLIVVLALVAMMMLKKHP